jgi:hypothetical protein
MKTEYRHIHFTKEELPKEKPTWLCRNNKSNSPLARIIWYMLWKKYVVEFNQMAVFDESCLADIQDFLRQLNAQKKSVKSVVSKSGEGSDG